MYKLWVKACRLPVKAEKDVGTIFCGPISTWNSSDVRNQAFLLLARAAAHRKHAKKSSQHLLEQ